MALTATVYKATLQVSDLDRHVYDQFELVLARHPSETEQRMMLRLVAYALHADHQLQFTKGLCADDEPEIWQKDATGLCQLWIELGTPDPKRLKKACSRADTVFLYTYGDRSVPIWWQQNQAELDKLIRQGKLVVRQVADEELAAVSRLAARNMTLNAMVEDGQLWLSDEAQSVQITVSQLTE